MSNRDIDHYLEDEEAEPRRKPATLIVCHSRSPALGDMDAPWTDLASYDTATCAPPSTHLASLPPNHMMKVDPDEPFCVGYDDGVTPGARGPGYFPSIPHRFAIMSGLHLCHALLYYEERGWYIKALEEGVFLRPYAKLVPLHPGEFVLLKNAVEVHLGTVREAADVTLRVYTSHGSIMTEGISFRLYWGR